jgi:S1-C subfamily serine protease
MNMLQAFSRDLEELVARAAPPVVGVEHRRGHGSGVVLSSDGYVLTNAHVVRGGQGTKVRLSGGEVSRASIVGVDDRTDLAVVRAEASGLATLPFAEEKDTKVGQIVVAIGNPLRFERSVSLGVISAIDRTLPGPSGGLEGLIQTDAAINPGNSGGPLVDVEGRVVGISTAIIPFAQGIGFAVPAHTASWVAAVLIQHGEIRRPFLGIAAMGEPLNAHVVAAAGQARGVHVLSVSADSPASISGLKEGDLVLTANGQKLAGVNDLQRALVLNPLPDAELGIWRRGRRETLRVRPERKAVAA